MRKLGKYKKFIIPAAAVILVATVVLVFVFRRPANVANSVETSVTAVTRGSISRVLEGSGVLEAIDQYQVSSLVSGDVLYDYFEEGDIVAEGDILYKIDSSAIEKNISRAQNSLQSSQMSHSEAVESLNDLSVKATISGVVTNVYITEGSDISSGGKICDIIENDSVILNIDFLQQQALMIRPGQTAEINVAGESTRYFGTVKSVSSGSVIGDMGVPVSRVEITVSNPGGIKAGDTATALVAGIAGASPGTFTYPREATVTAKTGGTIRNLSIKDGDKVNAGQLVAKIENQSVSNQSKKSALSLNDARLTLENYYDDLDQYTLTAPISGKVIQKSIKAGDKIASMSGSTSMALIADLSAFTLTMSVDELDITGVKVGQTARIEADALTGELFEGTVNNVSIVGTSENGVTTYPVEILIENVDDTDLMPGMNVTATIVIEEKHDVLTIPITAVNRGNTVKMAETDEEVPVQTGINDGTNVEIISGLTEGDRILVHVINVSSDTLSNMMRGGMGMPSGGAVYSTSPGGGGGGAPVRVQQRMP